MLMGNLKTKKDMFFELSYSQEEFWYIYKLFKNEPYYIIYLDCIINGELDTEIFKNSFNIIVNNNDNFRTVFFENNSKVYQKILDKIDYEIEYEDISHLTFTDEYIKSEKESSAKISFDLEKAPLFKIKLVKISDEKYLLYFYIHHIVMDGWSVYLFLTELQKIYNSLKNQKKIKLLNKKVSYKDYVQWQKDEWYSEDDKLFWLNELSEPLPVLNLSNDYSLTSNMIKTYRIEKIHTILEKDLVTKLRQLAQKNNVTLHILLLSSYFYLLHYLTKDEDIIVGISVLGRPNRKFLRDMGQYANLIPIRIDFENIETFSDLILKVNNKFDISNKHSNYPFILLEKHISNKIKNKSILSTTFEYQARGMLYKSPTIDIEVKSCGERSMIDFSVVGREIEDVIKVDFSYNSKLFKTETIRDFMEKFNLLLENITGKIN